MGNYIFTVTENVDVTEYHSCSNKSVFTTLPWIRYISEDSAATPIFVRITKDEQFIGYFTGLTFRKFGFKILGSPFAGWSTCYMGIDTDYTEQKIDIINELIPFLYRETKCQYIEMVDRDILEEDLIKHGIKHTKIGTLELNVDMDDDLLFKQMKTDCRNFIRQFERRGARIEQAVPDDRFAEEYYNQLQDVFAKQGLVPTYSLEKVKCLLRNLKDSGEVLCLRVISPDDRCIATSIFPGYGNKFFFWGGASYRPDQHYRPNEYMIWTAIKYWRDKGCKTFDMVGIRDYKKKFGSHEVSYTRMFFVKHKVLLTARNIAEKCYYRMTKVKGTIMHKS